MGGELHAGENQTAVARQVAGILDSVAGARVLCLGAGTNLVADLLAARGASVITLNAPLPAQAVPPSMPLADGSVTSAVAWWPLRTGILEDLRRVLSPGGRLVVVDDGGADNQSWRLSGLLSTGFTNVIVGCAAGDGPWIATGTAIAPAGRVHRRRTALGGVLRNGVVRAWTRIRGAGSPARTRFLRGIGAAAGG